MGIFKRKQSRPDPIPARRSATAESEHPGDWITVPFRFVEAARVSIHMIAAQDQVPPEVRLWIGQWLDSYNRYLIDYMTTYYGPSIIPLLDLITNGVIPSDRIEGGESWEQWERQFREES
jgi:hypothetical protein